MKGKIKLKGRLRNHLYWPLIAGALLVLMNVPVYFISRRAGGIVSGFSVVYLGAAFYGFFRMKPVLIDELVNFATQYGTVQKQLLNEFEIPYALLDYNGKF